MTRKQINNDRFQISIYELLYKNEPKNDEEIKELLDNNGYYGRYEIIHLMKQGKKCDLIKIKVYMPDSNLTYYWPPNTHYSISQAEILKEPKGNVDYYLLSTMKVFCNCEEVCIAVVQSQSSVSYGRIKETIEQMYKYNLIGKDGKLIFKSEEDCDEYFSNMITCLKHPKIT